MTQIEVPISLTAFGCEPRPATAHVIEQSILVPTFLTAGIVMAVKRAREERRLTLVRGARPRCRKAQAFKAGGRFASGRSLDCPACHGMLTLLTPERPT